MKLCRTRCRIIAPAVVAAVSHLDDEEAETVSFEFGPAARAAQFSPKSRLSERVDRLCHGSVLLHLPDLAGLGRTLFGSR